MLKESGVIISKIISTTRHRLRRALLYIENACTPIESQTGKVFVPLTFFLLAILLQKLHKSAKNTWSQDLRF